MIVRPGPDPDLPDDSKRAPGAHRHPTLGLPPIDMTAGFPHAADRIREERRRLAARALESAISFDPSISERYSELGLRRLLNDTEVLIERLARSVASGDPRWIAEHAERAAIVYRRRAVPLRDLQTLCEGIRDAAGAGVGPDERITLDASLDAAIFVFEREGGIAGDAKHRNAILKFLYRGP